MINVGDIVKVTDWGKGYSTNADWIEKHYKAGDIPLKYVIHFAYGDCGAYVKHQYNDNAEYKVLYKDEEKALITRNGRYVGETYILGLAGIEEYKTEMTVAEIEKKLGIRNLKIIKED